VWFRLWSRTSVNIDRGKNNRNCFIADLQDRFFPPR
jgi:hypothetical protein